MAFWSAGEPDDIAWAMDDLASDESKFVTGTALVVQGGYTARRGSRSSPDAPGGGVLCKGFPGWCF